MSEIFVDALGYPLCKIVGGHKKPILKMYPSHSDRYQFSAVYGDGDLVWYSQSDMSTLGFTVPSFGAYYTPNTELQGYIILYPDTSVFPFLWYGAYNIEYWGDPPMSAIGSGYRDSSLYSSSGCINGAGGYYVDGNNNNSSIGTFTLVV